jgi:uncharacterized damage-inducible protein DinB
MTTTIDFFINGYEFNRVRTLGLLERIEQQSDPRAALGWRPGPGRAHIAWQLMHIGVTEEIFATERLLPAKAGAFTDLWPRFRGGSTPDDQIPNTEEIRRVLREGRDHLLETLSQFGEEQLQNFSITLRDRTLTLREVLHIIGWHEPHHQGQAHITLNLYLASR